MDGLRLAERTESLAQLTRRPGPYFMMSRPAWRATGAGQVLKSAAGPQAGPSSVHWGVFEVLVDWRYS